MQYGLTLRSQERLHRAVTQRLSPTFSFDDVYLALALDDLERDLVTQRWTRRESAFLFLFQRSRTE